VHSAGGRPLPGDDAAFRQARSSVNSTSPAIARRTAKKTTPVGPRQSVGQPFLVELFDCAPLPMPYGNRKQNACLRAVRRRKVETKPP